MSPHSVRLLRLVLLSIPICCVSAMIANSNELVKKVEEALPPHIGACVLAIDDDQVVFRQAWGRADAERATACTPATNFRMASVSKQFTAAAVMLLVDRGTLQLDDTLERFFPDFPTYGDKITVKHLLTHSSGVPAYEELIPAGTTLQLDDLGVLQLLMETEGPVFEAGEKFEYSNSAFVLLGLMVEIAAEKPFHAFMQEELFEPLGMNGTVVYQRGLNNVPNRAYGHEQQNGEWRKADQSVTSATRGDGCVYTSLNDYHKWLLAIEQRKLLAAKTWEAILTPHVVSDRDDSRYGFGWFLDEYRGQRRVHHNGDSRGFRLCVQRYPERQAAVLVQLNGEFDDEKWPMTRVGERLADILIYDRPST